MTDLSQDPETQRWNHHPGREVMLNPLFQWPPDVMGAARWYRGAWLQVTGLTVPFVLAVVMYVTLIPPLAAMQSFAAGWMFQVWLANMIPQIIVAGGLHWWLYSRKGQGLAKKFDKRDLAYDNGTFTFRNQLWDNVFWTLGSAITVATVYQWVIFWAMANGFEPLVRKPALLLNLFRPSDRRVPSVPRDVQRHVSTGQPGDEPFWF